MSPEIPAPLVVEWTYAKEQRRRQRRLYVFAMVVAIASLAGGVYELTRLRRALAVTERAEADLVKAKEILDASRQKDLEIDVARRRLLDTLTAAESEISHAEATHVLRPPAEQLGVPPCVD